MIYTHRMRGIVVRAFAFGAQETGKMASGRVPRVWELGGLIPGQVIPKTLKMTALLTVAG